MRILAWLTGSITLHGVILVWATLSPTPADGVVKRQATVRPDVWQGTFVDLAAPKTAKSRPPKPDSRLQPEAVAAALQQKPAPLGKKPARQSSGQARARPRGHPAPEPLPAAKRTPPAKHVSETSEYGQDEWLSVDDQLEPVSNPPTSASSSAKPTDAVRDRLLASERRKAQARRAQNDEPHAASPGRVSERPRGLRGGGKHTLKSGVRDLSTAFTRALPYAGNQQASWVTHRLGRIGTTEVRIHLKSSRISEYHLRSGTSEALSELVRRTMILLQAGQFALIGTREQTGTLRLLLTAELSKREPRSALSLGYEPPSAHTAGAAYFELPSGRRLTASVKLKAD